MTKQSHRAPWPSMRGNPQNTGVSPVVGFGLPDPQQGLQVRHFRTGNGIFSTPIIGADETIYIGSADGNFYALDPLVGEERWRFGTGEVIDSAGCIDAQGTIYMASCDACVYALEPGDGAERWRIDMLKDRTHFSPSTIYWWEANVVQGPGGLLYAPSDDFYLYAIDPGGEVRWAGLTGLLIWSAPGFAPPGERPLVYVASFDTCLYGFDAETGEVVWREPTGNFVASSPAVSDDGTLHVGSFDGGVYAHDGQTGALRWKIATGGPIYASAALGPEGMLYIGSSDGLFYAVSTRDQQVAWTFYAGDAIRSSAALGPDPEGRADYLIYFGAGNGQIYALDPTGQRRWSYDTLTRAPTTEYPNINASVALGRRGLATASANGDVIYIPYDAYRQGGDGFTQEASDGYPTHGAYWYHISPGGAVAQRPVPTAAEDEAPLAFGPAQTLSLRPVLCDGGARPTVLDPDTVDVELDPPLPHWVALLPDRSQISVIPTEPAQHDQVYTATIRAAGIEGGGEVLGQQRLVARGAAGSPSIHRLPQLPFSITHMSVHSPPIVPAFDQIGIASLTIDARVVDVDRDSGRVVAWGLLKFGSTDSGDAVGTANPRHLFYAFSGLYRGGDLILETRDCIFELTGFPVPLDYLRFAGSYDDSGAPALGTSMVAEHRLRGVGELLSGGGWAETPSPAELLFAVGRGVRSTQTVLGWITSFVGTWFPKENLIQSLPQMARAARLTLPLAWDIFGRSIYRPWGLFDEQGQFSGVGTFRATAQDRPALEGNPVRELRYDRTRRRVVAELNPQAATAVPGVLIIDDQAGLPLYLDYNRLTRTRRGEQAWTVELDLPLSVATRGKSLRAVVMVDTDVAGELPL